MPTPLKPRFFMLRQCQPPVLFSACIERWVAMTTSSGVVAAPAAADVLAHIGEAEADRGEAHIEDGPARQDVVADICRDDLAGPAEGDLLADRVVADELGQRRGVGARPAALAGRRRRAPSRRCACS